MPPIAFGRAAPFGCCQPREADKEGQGAGTVSTEATEAAGEDGGEHAEAEGEQRPVGAAQWRWSEQLFASFLSLPMTDVIVNESGKDEWTEGRGRVPRSDG